MSIAGKFVAVGEEGFGEWLVKEGFPADKVAERRKEKSIFEFKVDGQKIVQIHTMGDKPSQTTEFVLGQEFEEKMGNRTLKSVAKLAGNVLTIVSKNEDGKERTRTLKFNHNGLDVVHKSANGEGKIIYKRE